MEVLENGQEKIWISQCWVRLCCQVGVAGSRYPVLMENQGAE